MNNITYTVSVDVNNPIVPYNVYVANVLDSNVRYLEITLYQNGNVIALSNTATATASLVTDNVLVNGSVNCTIQDNIITVPLEDLQRHGNLDVQVTVTEGTKVLAIPFPIQVRVTPNIAENAQIDENSLGSYAEVVHEITEARGTYTTLHDAIAAKLSTAYTFDSTTTNVVYNVANPKTIYTNAHVDNKDAFVFTTANNYYQIALCYDGTEYTRQLTSGGSTTYKPWALVNNENTGNKKNSITASNKTSTTLYPSIKAVVDYLAANYLGSGDNTVSWANLAAAVQTVINGKESASNKLSSEEGIDSGSTDTEYPSAKAVYDLGVEILGLVNDDISNVESSLVLKESSSNKQSSITAVNKASTTLYPSIKAVVDYLVANYENLSNKLTSEAGIDEDSTDTEYPTAKAVFDFGTDILNDVNGEISDTNADIADLKAYIGYTDGGILGLHANFENKRFTRLGAAAGLTAGQDFNAFPMYGQRRRVVVDLDGVIMDGYSPEDVGESDTDVDVMVYQPKFYYKVVPLKLEKQSSGLGYHIRKANYYISSTPHAGFKLHPLFFDKNGNEIDYVLFSAYEASYMWRRQVSTNGTDFRYVDSIFHDGVNTDTTIETSAVLKSLPGVKPISGQYKALTKANMETLAQNKSPNWHLDTIKSVSANQLLMAIELGTFNTQTAIRMGIVNNSDSGSNNCSSLTGSTSALGNVTGMAGETIYDVAGTETPFNTNGKVAVSYRGMENPWGNIWKQINGINVWGNGSMSGGQVYIADRFTFNESSHSGDYKPAGFSVANANGWISAFGYGKEEFDWLFLPSETTGNSSLPVGDRCYCLQNLNGYRIARLGGRWSDGYVAGGFSWSCGSPTDNYSSDAGGRLLFVPTATV